MRALLSVLLLCLALPAHAASLRVVADIPPVASLVQAVLGDGGTVETLLPPGASPHDHALKPSDARALQDADLVVWIGPALTPNLARSLDTLAGGATRLTLADATGTHLLPPRETALFDAHGHDHAHDHGHGHSHDADAPYDPHLWLDPDNASLWLGLFAETFAKADPDGAAQYRANAAAAQSALAEAADTARTRLAEGVRPLALLHDGLYYFEDAFGLTTLGALTPSDAASPSPRRMAALRDALPAGTCLLVEAQYDPRLVAALGDDVAVAEVDPLGAMLPQDGTLYPALLVDLATRIAACGR